MFHATSADWLHRADWSANGITSMLASVLGMALSIEFGIAWTYGLGACEVIE
jgi:hypothetical protein